MMWSFLAIGFALLFLAAFTAWAYVRLDPIRPDPRELSDRQVADILSGTGTEVPRRGV